MLQQQKPLPQGENFIFVPTMVWISILFSVGMLWFVASQSAPPAPESQPGQDISIFYVVAAIAAAASFLVPKYMIQASIRQTPQGRNPAEAARGIFFVAFLVRIALREAVAIIGFLLVSMGHPLIVFTYFGSAAAVLILLAKPSHEEIKEIEHQLRMKAGSPASP